MYRQLIELIGLVDAPMAHRFAHRWTRIACRLHCVLHSTASLPGKPIRVMGLSFPNPVGLAAGFDRNGDLLRWLPATGFGFVEIGTVACGRGEIGNAGLQTVLSNLTGVRPPRASNATGGRQLVGVSLRVGGGDLDDAAAEDVLAGMDRLWEHADYLVLNLSRPDSATRSPQADPTSVRGLLRHVEHGKGEIAGRRGRRVPVIVKVALEPEFGDALPAPICLVNDSGFDGCLVTFEHWGSNQRIAARIEHLAERLDPMPLLVAGGARTADDVVRYLNAGAALVEIYTAFFEKGPFLARRLLQEMAHSNDRGVIPPLPR